MPVNINIFQPVNEAIIQDIVFELSYKGHQHTGDLEKSLVEHIDFDGKNIVLSASALHYIFELEHGVQASRIDVSQINMTRLSEWVEFRLNQGHPTPSAKEIVKLWKKYGYELEGAKKYSPEGETTNAIRNALVDNKEKHKGILDRITLNTLDAEFSRLGNKTI